MSRNRLSVAGFSLVLLGLPGTACAQLKAGPDDWPAWRGADRTGVSAETGLLKEWPEGGPRLVWKATGLGGGYSTPSIAGGRIYLLGSKAGEEFAIALDAKDGKELWRSKIGPVAKSGPPSYPGPLSTPTVDGDKIYVLGSDGDLACLEQDGKVVWQKNLDRDLGGQRGRWACAESPLIDGEVLVCTPGGPKDTLAALNKKTGRVIWRAAAPEVGEAGYSSVIVTSAGGVKQYVQLLGKGLVGVSAKDGKVLWQYAKMKTPTNCPTPISHDGYIFSSYQGPGGGGSALLQLSADGQGVSAREVYSKRDLANQHGGVVRVGDYVYGTNSRVLVCIDFKTGTTKWQDSCVGKGSICAADGHLYVRGENDGQVVLVEATPSAYKETGRLQQPDRSNHKAWPHPVIANGCLYLRDDDVLLCYDIKTR
jgi:outer membrane protein assembly factor BamB